MKKSLLAVAVAAALPTFAQAQSSVTMFGILDASVEYSDSQANAGTPAGTGQVFQEGDSGFRLNSGLQSGSRFGIRGVEDIGGGLKGIFTIEHRLDVSTGETAGGNIFLVPGAANTSFNNKFWNGQAWVGLETRFGNITMGRQYSPLFWALIPADFTVYGFYNNWAGFSGTNLNGASTQGPFRLDNSLAYKSPTMGGLTVWATYAFGENLSNNPGTSTAPGSGTTGSGDIWGVAAGWQLGGLYLAAGYHSIDVKRWAGATVTNGVKDVMAGTASYKFTNFGVSLGYSEINFELAASSPKLTNIMFSGFANLGPGTLFVNATQLDASGFTGLRNDSGLQLGVAYSVPLSKRTNWYAAYGLNDVSGLQSTTATTLIDGANRFSIGVRHLF
ncbi:MAG: porin [Burkholderiales bacterium]|nr:porin [Burkholderiales bacterium]